MKEAAPILKLRLGTELYARISKASDYFAIDKAEIVRKALRKFCRLKPVVVKEKSEGSTYKGTVLDVPLIDARVANAKGSEARKALDWYLALHEPIPEPLFPNIEQCDATLEIEQED